jgi:hypothetical protein
MPNIIKAPQVKFDTLAAFPVVGILNKLYTATDTNEIYIWD